MDGRGHSRRWWLLYAAFVSPSCGGVLAHAITGEMADDRPPSAMTSVAGTAGYDRDVARFVAASQSLDFAVTIRDVLA